MLDIYKSVGNSLSALESALRLSISNADNFNTPGYKYSFATFTTVFNNVISSGTEDVNPKSLGGSMTLGSTSTDFSQGNIGFGTNMDVAISGDGFFLLSQSAQEFGAGGQKVYTRNGRFQVDFSNTFVTDTFGRKVFGFQLDQNGNRVSSTLVPVQTHGQTDIGFIEGGILVGNFSARKDAIAAGDPNPPEFVPLYQLGLTSFQNKQGLVIVDGAAYKATIAAGEELPIGVSGEGPYGDVLPEALEASNIDVAKVALDMALLNRGFNAIQGVIDDINKILNGLISKLQA